MCSDTERAPCKCNDEGDSSCPACTCEHERVTIPRAPSVPDFDDEEKTAVTTPEEVAAQARDEALVQAAAHAAVGLLMPTLRELVGKVDQIGEKLDGYRASVEDLTKRVEASEKRCAARHGNGSTPSDLADTPGM